MSPWFRIDENAMDHPKFLALTDGAWRLWCEGQAFCRKHLTDGIIPPAALKGFRYFRPARLQELLAVTVPGKGPCWYRATDGTITVHDFLEWNDSRDAILKARDEGRERKKKWKEQRNAVPDTVPDVVPNASRDASVPCWADADAGTDLQTQRSIPNTARSVDPERGTGKTQKLQPVEIGSNRPVFRCSRFVVFDWMLARLMELLGPHTNDFALDQWFETLEKRADAGGFLLDKRKVFDWIYAATIEEAERRGLKVVGVNGSGHESVEAMAEGVRKILENERAGVR